MDEAWNSANASNLSPQLLGSKRAYRLAHQTLAITYIDFDQRLILGFTQLVIWPTSTNLRRIHLNCRQCRIHRILLEPADRESNDTNYKSKLTPQATDLPIIYTDPSLEVCKRDTKLRTLNSYQRAYASIVSLTDADNDFGEITVRLPPDYWSYVSQKQPLHITLEFSLNKPKSGIYFVVPEGEGSLLEREVYAFTAFTPNCARLWFPCIDCSEPCTWKIEVTVFEDLVAIASGELIDAPYYTEDLAHKTYHFYLSQPVAAPYIGFAVGAFEIYPDSRFSNGTTHFCPAGLTSLLKHTISPIAEIMDYYESILASQYPFHAMKTVFVDCAFSDFQSFASLLIFSIDLLHSKRIIDQAIQTKKVLSLAVAYQFFGSFLSMHTWNDAWLPFGIAGYLSGLYQRRVFGNNEYRKIISDEMEFVTNYENSKHGILLDPSKMVTKNIHFGLNSPHLISPDYLTAYIKKSHLVIRMLELRLGQPVLLQVLNKLLVLARLATKSISFHSEDDLNNDTLDDDQHSMNNRLLSKPLDGNRPTIPPCMSDEHRGNLLLSTSSFRRIISMVTGQDIQNFLDQWAACSGHVRLFAKFYFNRKRNIVELELKQDLQSKGTLNYTGPITVMLQELDGAFMHTFKLEEGRMCRDLPCHSKSRKHRKKKIPLINGDEVDMDLSRVDSEIPLLWIRLDPNLALISQCHIDQPDFMWHLMLVHDRDCLGQLEAVRALKRFASPSDTRHVLTNIILNERIFYRVRMEACHTLCHIINEFSTVGSGGGGGGGGGTNQTIVTSCLLPLFWQFFSSPASRGLIRQNNFSNLQHYFLQRALIRAFGTLRIQQVCPREVLVFLADLLRHNDNSRNSYSDCYYLADVINAMKDSLTPAIMVHGVVVCASALPFEARTVVEEVSHMLNLETVTPSYKSTVSVACLLALRRLQRLGFLSVDANLFKPYTSCLCYWTVRLAAVEVLVDFIRGERDQSTLDWLFEEIVEKEDVSTDASNARFRFETIQMLRRNSIFQRTETGSRLDTPQLVERLWTLMNYGCTGDPRLRCAVADLYYTLYGNRRPTCLPLPEGVLLVRVKEGRSVLNLADKSMASEPHDDEDGAIELESDSNWMHFGESRTGTGSSTMRSISNKHLGEIDWNTSDYLSSHLGAKDVLDGKSISPLKRRMQRLSDDDDDDDDDDEDEEERRRNDL